MSSSSTSLAGFYAYTETLKGVHYGPGSVKTALPKLLATIGGKKALVVTGKSLYTGVRVFFASWSPVLILYLADRRREDRRERS